MTKNFLKGLPQGILAEIGERVTPRSAKTIFFAKTLLSTLVLAGCASSDNTPDTLASWDQQVERKAQAPVFVAPKNQAEVQQAYEIYLQNAGADEKGRRTAMERLARLELARAQDLQTQQSDTSDSLLTAEARASLERTVQLLEATRKEFPDAPDGDATLYQLAQSYEKLGMPEQSLANLQDLSNRYPKSEYFAEAQFRAGEQSFLDEDYFAAEVAYSDVIYAGPGHPLYEKALMKRGWARLKQHLAMEASEDFAAAIKARRFAAYQTLAASEKSDFDEYTRALTLAVRDSGNFDVLEQHFDAAIDADYIYHVYSLTARLQMRNKDFAPAVATLDQYADKFPNAKAVANARVLQLTALRLADSQTEFAKRLDSFYQNYAPNTRFWQSLGKSESANFAEVSQALRTNMLVLADREQKRFRATRAHDASAEAQRWYQRYLNHFGNFARQDKVYFAYAELRAAERDLPGAIALYEKAAYDGDIVLDKEAAYATIDLADQMVAATTTSDSDRKRWLEKLLAYAERGIQIYGSEKRFQDAALRALQLAYNQGNYDAVLALGDSLPNNLPVTLFNQANYLKALAELKQQDPEAAETLLRPIIGATQDPKRSEYREAMALAIYEQGKRAFVKNDVKQGLSHWSRLASTLSDSKIAPDALYEAINKAVAAELWPEAASLIEQFQRSFAKHRLYADATRQLSMVYLKTGATDRAAQVFESIAAQDSDADVQVAALWQAAELYETQGKTQDAIRAFSNYAKRYPSPFPQYMEAMHKLVALYDQQKNMSNAFSWRHKIIAADRNTAASHKTDRTLTIAANAALQLAEQELALFTRVRLVEPLDTNLRLKRKHMQSAMTLFGQAAGYKVGDITLQSTYSLGFIYQHFSRALLDSERPAGLTDLELDEYNMLLEDQAFPFEEKAIEFYEVNMARTAEGSDGQWIEKSLSALKTLFPSRYDRSVKFPIYIVAPKEPIHDASQ